jgi:flagellar motor protein MotB
MNKHRHLPLIFGFLMMAASTAAGQIKAPADEVNTAASPFNTATSPFNAGQVNTHTGPFSSPFNTTASPFNTATRPFNAGQVNSHTGPFKTAKPGEPVERHLSDDQKFREWSLQSDATDVTKRIKVCRVEDVCKMRFKEGFTPRTRVRNIVVPLRYDDENTPISEAFTRQVRQALDNLRDKQSVRVRFIGYTDDAPLTGRDQSIYGDHLSLSKARAQRVALAMQETLGLPASAIESDGRGASHPVASNDTVQGRALNRRVEVEFWYDDPLQALPDEPQLCPGDVQEVVTKVYDPPWGSIPALELTDGQPIIPAGYAANLRRALTDIADRTNPRLRFIGYTKNERLDRRTASVYGDDIGLSAARARRTMDIVMQDPVLSGAKSEHEGRGYVQSDDVVNAGFIQGQESFVRVQVVYDEPLPLDNYEGIDITRLTQELRPKSPYDLNVMHITVDGKPIDDPNRSSSDVQRCTDVALDNANIQFRFDNLESRPRLSVAAHPVAVSVSDVEGVPASVVRFRMYTNYSSFIERAEIRIFEQEQSLQAAPLEIIAVDGAGLASWQP